MKVAPGSISRTVSQKLSEVASVRDFGAKGDGVADDTAAIQAALDYAGPLGIRVSLPPGIYIISGSLRCYALTPTYTPYHGLTLEGAGEGSVVIMVKDSCTPGGFPGTYTFCNGIEVSSPLDWTGSNPTDRVTIKNLTLDGNKANVPKPPGPFGSNDLTHSGIFVAQSTNLTISDVTAKNWWYDGINLGLWASYSKISNIHTVNNGYQFAADAVSFTGSGLNDASSGGVCTSTYPTVTSTTTWTVQVTGTGTPDTIEWRKDTGSWNTGVPMAALVLLSDGVGIKFAHITGHAIGDSWKIQIVQLIGYGGLAPGGSSNYNAWTNHVSDGDVVGLCNGSNNHHNRGSGIISNSYLGIDMVDEAGGDSHDNVFEYTIDSPATKAIVLGNDPTGGTTHNNSLKLNVRNAGDPYGAVVIEPNGYSNQLDLVVSKSQASALLCYGHDNTINLHAVENSQAVPMLGYACIVGNGIGGGKNNTLNVTAIDNQVTPTQNSINLTVGADNNTVVIASPTIPSIYNSGINNNITLTNSFGRNVSDTTSFGGLGIANGSAYRTGRGDGNSVRIILVTPPEITVPVFTGTGLNDVSSGGAYTNYGAASYTVQVTGIGTPDTIEWRKNSGSWNIGVPMAATVPLMDGVTVSFAATTGHHIGDYWTISVVVTDELHSGDPDGQLADVYHEAKTIHRFRVNGSEVANFSGAGITFEQLVAAFVMSGSITLPYGAALYLKDSGGTARRVLLSNLTDIDIGDVDNALGGSCNLFANQSVVILINGSVAYTFSATGLTGSGVGLTNVNAAALQTHPASDFALAANTYTKGEVDSAIAAAISAIRPSGGFAEAGLATGSGGIPAHTHTQS